MKTIFLTLCLVFAGLTGLLAQPNPNDLAISGYIASSNGGAVDGQWVCVNYSGSNPSIADSTCGYTNSNGWYQLIVVNGSLTGPNQTFEVVTQEYCQNTTSLLTETVQNAQGTVDTATVNFTLSCTPQTFCAVAIDFSVSPNDSTVYSAVGTAIGTAPFAYQWDNGSATSSTTYVFDQWGIYGVCLTVTDATGCVASICDTVYVGQGASCDAYFYYASNPNGSVSANTNVQFYYSGQSSNLSSYTWTVQGGGVVMSSDSANPNFVFPSAGTYTVCLSVEDGQGCSNNYCATVNVVGGNTGNCQAQFYTTSTSTPNGNFVAFTDVSTGDPSFWSWDFGNGQTSTQQYPTTSYSQNGWYNVCLTVSSNDSLNCTSIWCDTIYVDNNTIADSCFAYFDYYAPSLDSVTFSAYGMNTSAQYVWDFGDGTSSSGLSVSHDFAGVQSWYWVCLTVYGATGCSESYCDSVYVSEGNGGGCSAAFTNYGQSPIGYAFSANVPVNGNMYSWSVDGITTQSNGYDLYVPGFTEGTHTVCLTVAGDSCVDTQCSTFYVSSDSCFGYISGQVFAGNANQPIDVAEVYLISYDSLTGQLTAVQTAWADSAGYYYFQNVPCGAYRIKAATTPNSAFYADHLPTYYGNSTFWQYANEVGVSWVQPEVQYDITLIGGNNPGGPGFIGGSVLEGANKNADEGDPLEGILVMLFDMTGNAIAYTYTDVNGQFGFDNLAYGTYQVYTELMNYTTIPAVVAIGEENPSVEEITIFVSDELISTGIAETDFDALVSGVYPNPVAGNTTLTVNFESAYEVEMSIVDLAGRSVSSQMMNILPGKNVVNIASNGLTDGYYFINVREQSGLFLLTRKFVIAH